MSSHPSHSRAHGGRLSQLLELVGYLQANLDQAPLKFRDIGEALGWSEEAVAEMFSALQEVYRLFRLQEREIAQRLDGIYHANAAAREVGGGPPSFSLTVEELQNLVDLDFFTGQHPQPLLTIQKFPRFHKLIVQYPAFFAQDADGWLLSPAGRGIARQFLQFRQINMVPGDLSADGVVVHVQTSPK